MGPTSGRRAIAQIQSVFRPVLITCTIKPAWRAMDRIGMRYNGLVSGYASQGPRTGYCSENGTVPAAAGSLGGRSRRINWSDRLRYANPALHVSAVGPSDIRQGIAQHALGARIDGDLHLAAMETRRGPGRLLRKKPDVYPLRRRLVDFARVTEYFLQSAHRFPDIVRGNARHRTDGISGVAATGQSEKPKGHRDARDTQHNQAPVPRVGIAVLPAARSIAADSSRRIRI